MEQIPEGLLQNLSEAQKTLLKECPPPSRLFAIITWGCAATTWLSIVLNAHLDIFCMHATNSAMILKNGVNRFYNWTDGLDYIQLISRVAFSFKVAGDILGISRSDVPELKKTLGKNFNAIVLVREPISRLKSQMALFDRLGNYQPWSNIDYVDSIIEKKGVMLPKVDYNHKLFVHGVNMLNSITQEAPVGKIFRAEDITTNESSLSDLIKEISGGLIVPEKEWLSTMLQISPINKHRKKDIFFSNWQIEIIKRVVDEKAWELYSKLGYLKPNFL